MNYWQVLLCLIWIARENERIMVKPQKWQFLITSPRVGSDDRSFCGIFQGKDEQILCIPARNRPQPQSPGINHFLQWDALAVRLALGCRPNLPIFALAHFDGSNDGCHIVVSSTCPARAAANKTFVHFHGILSANHVAFWANHSGTEFVQDLESGFVTGKAKLPFGIGGRIGRASA